MVDVPRDCYYDSFNTVIVCPKPVDPTGAFVALGVLGGAIFLVSAVLVIGYIKNILKLIANGDADPHLALRISGLFIPFIGGIVGYI